MNFFQGIRPQTLFVLSVGFITSLGSSVLAPLLPQIQAEFRISASEIGLLSASFGLARLLLDLPAGYMVNRFNPFMLQMIGIVIVIFSSIWAALSYSFTWILVARMITGAGSALVAIANLVQMARIGDARHRGRDLGLYQATTQTSFSVGPLLAGLVAPFFGWQGAFWLVAILSLLALPVILLLPDNGHQEPLEQQDTRVGEKPSAQIEHRPETSGGAGEIDDEDRDERHPATPKSDTPAAAVSEGGPGINATNDGKNGDSYGKQRLRNIVAAHLVTFVMFFTARGFSSSILPLYGGNVLGMSAPVLGAVMGLNSVMRIVLSLVGGVIADRYGRRAILVPGMLMLGVIMAFLPWITSPAAFFIFAMLLGLARFGNNVPATLLADNVSRTHWGSALGLNRFIADLAVVVGPVFLGYLVDVSGFGMASYFCAVISLASGFHVFASVKDIPQVQSALAKQGKKDSGR